jgi:uncharacterized membrane protein (DUF2068 family)
MAYRQHLTRWDDWILRVIAVYHLLKAGFFLLLGLGLLHFVHYDMARIIKDYLIEPFKLEPHTRFLQWFLECASNLTPHRLRLICYLFFFYSLIFAAEGIGLYLRKRWAEYMVVIVVSSLLPFEIYEISLDLAWWKVVIFCGNALIIAFLVRRLILEEPESASPVHEPVSGLIPRGQQG